jgi:hypothetical protein
MQSRSSTDKGNNIEKLETYIYHPKDLKEEKLKKSSHATTGIYLNKPEATSDFTPNISLASSRLVSSSSLSNLTTTIIIVKNVLLLQGHCVPVLSIFF